MFLPRFFHTFTFSKRIFLILCILGICNSVWNKAYASNPLLSAEARITLVTVDGGQELYTAFGHSAVRVEDSNHDLDVLFNYGTFDFDQPGFYTKFMQGHMVYQLSVSTFSRFVLMNTLEERYTFEQELKLTSDQRQRVFDYLIINAQPENKDYRYDFFFDNCASRIRDVLQEVVHDSIVFQYPPSSYTFRDLLHQNLTHHPWSRLGLDIILGLPCDTIADAHHQMFLPGLLAEAFQNARLQGHPLVGEEVALNDIAPKTPRSPWVTLPTLCAWLLFLLGVGCAHSSQWRLTFDSAFFSLVGLLGVLITYMWFFTAHTATHQNLNILWAIPTHVFMAYGLQRTRYTLWRSRYFQVITCLSLFALCFWPFSPQDLHPAVIPISLLLVYRSAYYAGWDDAIACLWNKRKR